MLENFGIGIDIVNIKRFKNLPYRKNKSFYEKIFHPSEIKYCLKYKDPSKHFAGKFAIKESTIKSIKEKASMLDIKTSYHYSKPIVRLLNNENYNFLVSLSHENEFAIAVVVSIKN